MSATYSIKPYASYRVVVIDREGVEHYLSEGQSYATALGIHKDYLRRITESCSYSFERDLSGLRCTIYRGARAVEQVEVEPMPRHRHTYEESEFVYCAETTNDGMCANPGTCPANPTYKPRHRKEV